MMEKLNTPNVKKLIDLIDDPKNGVKIAKNWIKEPTVQNIFAKYGIDPIKFLENYGLYMIDYFSLLIKEKAEVGDCPYTIKIVEEFVEKNVEIGDLFLIYSYLKKNLIDFFFERIEDKNFNLKDLVDEINFVFDQNLAVILNMYAKQINKI